VDVFSNNEWKQKASQTTIGRKRILRFPNVVATQVRLNIVDSKACPVISNIGVYNAPKVIVEPVIQRNKNGEVSIHGFDNGLEIYYTVDGNEPTSQSLKYAEGTKKSSPVTTVQFDVSKENWKLKGEFESVEQSRFMFDGNPETAWKINNKPPVDVIVDLAETLNLTGFTYLPDQGRWNQGIANQYELYTSNDGLNWGNPVSKGEFANIKNSPVLQKKEFEVVNARFLKFRILSSASENGNVGIAEFDVITQ